jgi:hypothetical protein
MLALEMLYSERTRGGGSGDDAVLVLELGSVRRTRPRGVERGLKGRPDLDILACEDLPFDRYREFRTDLYYSSDPSIGYRCSTVLLSAQLHHHPFHLPAGRSPRYLSTRAPSFTLITCTLALPQQRQWQQVRNPLPLAPVQPTHSPPPPSPHAESKPSSPRIHLYLSTAMGLAFAIGNKPTSIPQKILMPGRRGPCERRWYHGVCLEIEGI